MYDVLKDAGKVLQEAGKIELYQKILETQAQLLEMQKRIQDLETEALGLKEKLKIKESITHHDTAYWIIKEDNKEDGPYCQRCYDKNEDPIRLNPQGHNYFICPECKNGFQVGPDTNPRHPAS